MSEVHDTGFGSWRSLQYRFQADSFCEYNHTGRSNADLKCISHWSNLVYGPSLPPPILSGLSAKSPNGLLSRASCAI